MWHSLTGQMKRSNVEVRLGHCSPFAGHAEERSDPGDSRRQLHAHHTPQPMKLAWFRFLSAVNKALPCPRSTASRIWSAFGLGQGDRRLEDVGDLRRLDAESARQVTSGGSQRKRPPQA